MLINHKWLGFCRWNFSVGEHEVSLVKTQIPEQQRLPQQGPANPEVPVHSQVPVQQRSPKQGAANPEVPVIHEDDDGFVYECPG